MAVITYVVRRVRTDNAWLSRLLHALGRDLASTTPESCEVVRHRGEQQGFWRRLRALRPGRGKSRAC